MLFVCEQIALNEGLTLNMAKWKGLSMFKKTLLVCTLATVMFSATANATQGSGLVHFKGTVINAPCGIDPDSVEQTVDFGQISQSYLNGGNKTRPVDFDIKLVNCEPAALTNGVKVNFSGGTYADKTQLATSGQATNSAIKISSQSNGSIVEFGKDIYTDSQELIDGNNTLKFSAWVEQALINGAAATVDVGTFGATANFNLAYD